jgi:hypothetical protein
MGFIRLSHCVGVSGIGQSRMPAWGPTRVLRVEIGDERLHPAYSNGEKLYFSAEAIFQFYGNAAENLRKTRRTADRERLRAEIVKNGCSVEPRKFSGFRRRYDFSSGHAPIVFQPNRPIRDIRMLEAPPRYRTVQR